MKVHQRSTALLTLASVVLVSACGADAPQAVPTATVTVIEEARATVSPQPTITGSPTPTPSSTPTPSPSPGGTVPTARAGQPLGLVDAQPPVGEWEEARYEIADRSDVRAMGVPVVYCSDSSSSPTLEYRLANRFSTLSMTIAQANSSPQSDQEMTAVITGNGTQLDIQTIPFNQSRPLELAVAGVNALQIKLFLNVEVPTCGNGSGVTGVIENLVVS